MRNLSVRNARHQIKAIRLTNALLHLIVWEARLFLIFSPLLAVLGVMERISFSHEENEGLANIIRGIGGYGFGWLLLWGTRKTRRYLERKASGY